MRAIAGAVIAAFVALGAASTGHAEHRERIALARAEIVLAAAAVDDTRCTAPRDARSEAGCAAEDTPGEDAPEQPVQRVAPTAKPATGVCARNPETGRRKCSVRYLA